MHFVLENVSKKSWKLSFWSNSVKQGMWAERSWTSLTKLSETESLPEYQTQNKLCVNADIFTAGPLHPSLSKCSWTLLHDKYTNIDNSCSAQKQFAVMRKVSHLAVCSSFLTARSLIKPVVVACYWPDCPRQWSCSLLHHNKQLYLTVHCTDSLCVCHL